MMTLGSLALIASLSLQTDAFIIPSKTEPACPGVTCHNGGVLNFTSCTCLCNDSFTGMICDTELKQTKWPKGQYSLLSTVFGCPETDEYGWYRGYINMSIPTTKPNQLWKNPHILTYMHQVWPDPHLLGPYYYHSIQLNFCTRLDAFVNDSVNSDHIDDAETAWPNGDYCMVKAGRQCMKGFNESSVALVGYYTSLSNMDGTLPNISFTFDNDTGSLLTLTYCCMNDMKNTGTGLSLPSEFPFILIKLNGSTCPVVRDMNVTEERFDLVDDLDLFRCEGNHEILLDTGTHKRLGLCYYAVIAVRECMYTEDSGSSYRGSVNVSENGESCMDWYEANPDYIPNRYYVGDGFDENQCRTPQHSTRPRCYIKNTATGKISLDRCDIPICEPDTDLVEVGAFKPVYSVDPMDEEHVPENAVDNNIDGTPFMAERPQGKPWIQVDLEEFLEVHAVRVYRSLSGFPVNFRLVGVHIGLERWDFINYGALQCEDRRYVRRAAIFRFTCFRPIIGQFVTIRNFDDPGPGNSGLYNVLFIDEIVVIVKRSVCKRRMGLLSGEVRDFQLFGNWENNEYPFNNGRLLMPKTGWCSLKTKTGEYFFLVDHIVPSVISGLEIQGWMEGSTMVRVEEFTIQYAVQQDQYQWYTDPTGQPKIFQVDTSESVYSIQQFMFMKEFVARYVKLNIIKPVGRGCLKMEVIGCPKRVTRDIYCGNETTLFGYDVIDRTTIWISYDARFESCDLTCCAEQCDKKGSSCAMFTASYITCDVFKSNRYNQPSAIPIVPNFSKLYYLGTKLCVKEITNIKECGREIYEPGTIYSPNYPFYYGQLLECKYVVRFPTGVFPRVTFTNIQLSPPDTRTVLIENGVFDISAGSCEDRIVVGEHVITSANQNQYMGSSLVLPYLQDTIVFISCARYSMANAIGFLLNIDHSELPSCNEFFSWLAKCDQRSAVIYSPFYPARFRKNEAYRWEIIGQIDEYVKLKFKEMDIRGQSRDCDLSYVQVSDVNPADVKTVIGRYCSSNIPYGIIKSNWQRLEIQFVTSEDAEGRGFSAEYELAVYVQDELGCYGWEAFGHSCYQIFTSNLGLTWLSAESTCQEEDGHLVSLSSNKETEFIHALLLKENGTYTETAMQYYIGLQKLDTDGRYDNYIWSDGSPLTYTAWFKNVTSGQWQPDGLENERCTQLSVFSIHSIQDWHDVACAYDKIHRFICEKPAAAYNTTVEYNLPSNIKGTDADILWQLFRCNSSEFIQNMYLCDGVDDCQDRSDEICDNAQACSESGFRCTGGQCVSSAAHCDFQHDCLDGSDEKSCVYVPCLPWEWRCDSGQCISIQQRCDVKQDCYDGSDEINCDICHSSAFQCYDQRCITGSRVCDFNSDCSGRFFEDENQDCFITSQPTCAHWYSIGKRRNGTYLINAGELGTRDPFFVECVFIEENEFGTILVQTILHHDVESEILSGNVQEDYIQIRYGGSETQHDALIEMSQCKQYAKVECSYTTKLIYLEGYCDCVSSRDVYFNCSCPYVGNCEDACNCSKFSNNDWSGIPRDLYLIDSGYITDQYMLPIRKVTTDALTDGGLSSLKVKIGPLICEQDITGLNISETMICGNDKLTSSSDRCILEMDRYGATRGCRDLSHIQDCADMICPESYARCEDGYCLPIHLLCDGIKHCSKGEDELDCNFNPACENAFSCRHSSVCVELSNVCDGFLHCPYGDDERFCNIPHPDNCLIYSNELFCSIDILISTQHLYIDTMYALKGLFIFSKFGNEDIPLRNDTFYNMPYIIILNMTMAGISNLFPFQFSYNRNLIRLDISMNLISVLEPNTFYGLEQLQVLYLHGNPLHQIEVSAFIGLTQLPQLDLSNLKLGSLLENNFEGLDNLVVLNLSKSEINIIQAGAFEGLTKLGFLDIRLNEISGFDEGIFNGLQRLDKLYSSAFTMCCLRPSSVTENNCLPPKDEFSSCDDMMRNQVLRAFLWIIGFLALFGNFSVLLYRFIIDRDNLTKTYNIFVSNLGIADFSMGMYLVILAVADTTFRGRYVWNDHLWRNGITCKIAGMLSTLGSEGSVLFLCLITLDRFLVVKYPFGNVKISRNLCYALCLCTWILISLFAMVPLSTGPYFKGKFYSRSAVCLALPLTRDRPAGWEYSTGVFVVFNLMAFVLIVLGQIAIYREIYISRGRTTSSGRRHDITIARNLFMVATTDFLCWFPVGVMGVMALNGQVISGEVYAWIAVFVLPINSALNPFIYTIGATVNKKGVQKRPVNQGKNGTNPRDLQAGEISNVINSALFNFGETTFIEKITLEELLQKRKLTAKEVLLIAWRMSRSLHLLHTLDMYHGSLGVDKLQVKPTEQNLSKIVMITRPKPCRTEENLVDDVKAMGETLRYILKQNLQ